MKKKIHAVITIMVMLISLTSIRSSAFAFDVVNESGSCGENVTWTLTGLTPNLTLTIEGTGKMIDNYVYWREYQQDITNLIIGDGVTGIGKNSFSSLVNVSSVDIPDSVESIGDYAFSHCNNLKSIKIPDSVTSIGRSAFDHCISLKDIEIPNSITNISNSMLSQCESLETVTIPDSVTTIEAAAFAYCEYLSNISIPHSVTSIGQGAFGHCINLTNITIPDSVTSMDSTVFYECYSLTSLSIPNSITSIPNGLCNDCTSLTDITIPDSVTSIEERAFFGCDKLTSIVIPKSVSSIGKMAYAYVNSGYANPIVRSYFTVIGYPGSAAETYAVDNNLNFKAFEEPQLVWEQSGSTLTVSVEGDGTIDIPDYSELSSPPWKDAIGSVKQVILKGKIKSIGENAFSGVEYLYSIILPSSIKEIHENAFNCYATKQIYFNGAFPSIAANAFMNGKQNMVCFYPNEDSSWDPVRTITAESGKDSRFWYGGTNVRWMKNAGFRIYRDTNAMNNNLNKFGDMNTWYMPKLKELCKGNSSRWHKIKHYGYKKYDADTRNETGVCFGLATTMLLHKKSMLNNVFPSDTDYYNLKINDGSFKELYKNVVCYYHLIQYALRDFTAYTIYTFEIPSQYSTNDISSWQHFNDTSQMDLRVFLQTLVEKAEAAEAGGDPCLLGYDFQERGKKADGHIGVVCGYYYGDFDNSGESEHAVKIYDCNSTIPEFYYMYVGKDFSWFSYSDHNMSIDHLDLADIWRNMQIICPDDINKDSMQLPNERKSASLSARGIKRLGSNTKTGDSDQTRAYLEVPLYQNYSLSNSAGAHLVSTKDTLTGDISVYDYDIVFGEPVCFIETDASESFNVAGIDGEFSFSAEIGGKVYGAEIKNAKSVNVSEENGIRIVGDGSGIIQFDLSILDSDNADSYAQVDGESICESDHVLSFDLKDEKYVLDSDDEILNVHILSDSTGDVLEHELTEKDFDDECNEISFNGSDDAVYIDGVEYDPCKNGHTYGSWITTKKATYTAKGEKERTCSVCGYVDKAEIAMLARTSLAKAKVTGITAKVYTGSAIKQKPTVKLGTKTLKAGTHYKLTYKKNKNVGTATVTITGIGAYKGTITKQFKINPKGTTLVTPVRAPKSLTVKWKKQTAKMSITRITGYQVQVATNTAFTKNKKSFFVKGYSKTSKKFTKLLGGKKYYIRVRTYKTVNGVKYYSKWSSRKYATTKKYWSGSLNNGQ